MKIGSRLSLAVTCLLIGCAEGAKLVQDTGDGGVVVYPFKAPQGSMLSSFRKDAIDLMREKCGGQYTITREGETKGRTRVSTAVQGSQEMLSERRWGIEFRCKPSQ
ncbi:conserved exported protein of unknown function [Nitrospira sp. KM1]|uniref:hypothetical protein n=1 Tax=Nitrospira sp. KM1 TaxID=1936990 RepID=UPI0013A74251|nr:hypothetical protein [Nitrospira sp. KM1]BCA55376.1 conserved exported protein of unknown function [Nitrospira sp. KM1]